MSAPNHFNIVQATANAYRHLLDRNDQASITEYMSILGPRLAKVDPNWGWLTKSPGEKHIVVDGLRVAIDSFIYKTTNQVVDTISNAMENVPGGSGGRATEAWQERPKRPDNNWAAIVDNSGGSGDGDSDQSEEIRMLQAQVAVLQAQVATLQVWCQQLQDRMIATGDKVALFASNGQWVCADRNVDDTPLLANRERDGSWETFEINRK